MAADSSIQPTNLPWQIRLLAKNVSEWIQLQLSRDSEPEAPPTFEFPAWIGQVLFWLVITAGVVWLAWLVVQILDYYLTRRTRKSRQRPVVQPLYTTPERTLGDWLRQAKQFEREGNWREACRALYMAALQLLHDRGWLPHQPSRTDGEYLQGVQTLTPARPLQVLIRTHERSLFGGEALQADNLQRCRRAFEEIEKR
jgi:hypothetical protein